MRVKDDLKQDALFESTVALVNDIGFAASSVSKIAKAAKVSPATLYVYHKNKEDLLVSTYIRIKQLMSRTLLREFDESLPVRDCLRQMWMNTFAFVSEYPAYFQYIEQFSNSPYHELVDKEKIEAYFAPLFRVMNRGIEQKVLKDVAFDILAAFIFYPITVLANPHARISFELNEKSIETAFTLAWDAVKL